jgi:hypothetical protein
VSNADFKMKADRDGSASSLRGEQNSSTLKMFEREDWTSFRTIEGLQQKARVPATQLHRLLPMDFSKGMAETIAEEMPSAQEIAACKWLTDEELAMYAASRLTFKPRQFGPAHGACARIALQLERSRSPMARCSIWNKGVYSKQTNMPIAL